MLTMAGCRRPDDPFHFGDLGSAMLTLFRIATQEDWTDIMYFNMFGCDKWGDYISDVAESTAGCIPEAFGTMSPAFFVLYDPMHSFAAVLCLLDAAISCDAMHPVQHCAPSRTWNLA